jgi:6-phosphogluconolactonase
MSSPTRRVYIGSFTPPGGTGTGITLVDQDVDTGELRNPRLVATTSSPAFLAWHPDGHTLYAVNESTSTMQAFRVADDGDLTDLGTVPDGGEGPCHLSVDPSGAFLVVANYGNGTVVVHRIGDDGSLGEQTDLVAHTEPLGPNAARQDSAHAHQAKFDASGRWLLVNDLGTDAVYVYALDPETGTLAPGGTPVVATAPGAGPRHLVSLSHGWVYVANELNSTVASYAFDDSTGTLAPSAIGGSTVAAVGPENYPSEIAVDIDGRFAYVANRGADVVGTIALDGGSVTPIADTPTGGAWPRHLAVIGTHLYVANERSHDVTVFDLDPSTGVPTATGFALAIPSPGCILAAPLSLD